MTPRVSVIMTVRNGSRYIAETLNALRQQTLSDYELIVNDNGSTDATLDILTHYAARDPRIRILDPVGGERSFTMGICRAFGAATAPLIAVNDSDDISLPQRLQKQVNFLDMTPGVVAVASWCEHIDEYGKVLETYCVPTRLYNAYQTGNPISHSSLLYRRAAAIKAGGYCNQLTFASDYALQIKMVKQGGRIVVIPEPLVQIRIHDAQTSSIKNQRSQYYREPLEVLSAAALIPQVSVFGRLRGMFVRQKTAIRYGITLWSEGQYSSSVSSTIYWLLASLTSLWALIFIR